uniref:Uncharacterized protein n=1 Tax=Sphaerodactylus townsendi TaxID=933632 RepID=A0ACB8GCZ1_9SAUR
MLSRQSFDFVPLKAFVARINGLSWVFQAVWPGPDSFCPNVLPASMADRCFNIFHIYQHESPSGRGGKGSRSSDIVLSSKLHSHLAKSYSQFQQSEQFHQVYLRQ